MIDKLPPDAALKALLDALESASLGCTAVIVRGKHVERVYANAAIAKIWGVSVAAMYDMPILESLTPAERERLAALHTAIDLGGASVPSMLETTIVRPDGTHVPVELGLGYAMIGEERATFVFARDISNKATMEAALRESEERFRRLAEASPDSITVASGGKYVYANPVALGHLGLASVDELASFDPWSTVAPERRTEVVDQVTRLMRGERIPPMLHRRVTPGGREQLFEASVSLMRFGGAHAIISCSRDVTDRMHLQAELMKHDRLASIGVLAAGVAHELNNPLASLGMQVKKILDESEKRRLDAETKQAIEQIQEAANRMRAIISDLLFMSRPAEQPQAHVDVGKILSSTIALLRAGVPRCPTIRSHIGDMPPIHGYASKLGQVFFNVLRNAAQALEDVPNGTIDVEAHATEREVVIVIHDDGPGIPRELISRVTEPFFTTKPQGTGLGLWISQTIVAHHGGTLSVASDTGAGTTVTVTLPA